MGHCGTVWTTVLTKVSDLSVVFVQEKQNCNYLALNLRGTTEKTIQLCLEATFLVGGGGLQKITFIGEKCHLNSFKLFYFITLIQINQNTVPGHQIDICCFVQ